MEQLNGTQNVIAAIRLQKGAITPISDQLYLVDRELTKNPALDKILVGILTLLETYLATFRTDLAATVRRNEFIWSEWDKRNPFVILINLEQPSGPVHETTIKELQTIVAKFAGKILQQGEDLVSSDGLIALTEPQEKFVAESAQTFICHNENQNIAHPFICELPKLSDCPIAFQGKVNSTVHVDKVCEETSFFAKSDGAREDSSEIFLKPVDKNFKVESEKKKSAVYIAETFSMTQIASSAQASDFQVVKVRAIKRRDTKGTTRDYVQEIKRVYEHELKDFEFGDTLDPKD